MTDEQAIAAMPYEDYCPTCGSTEVARCKWVNTNNNQVYLTIDSGTTLEWCITCNQETEIKTRRKKK